MRKPKINQISLSRFNALGGYARAPGSWNVFDELEYFEVEESIVIGIATMDLTDQDFGGIVLAKDEKLRFRAVNVTEFCSTPEAAKEKLFAGMLEAASAQINDHYQGDEEGAPVDFFSHLHEENRLNPSFVQLTTNEGYSPAQEIIEPMMRWYDDADGNFVEQFQTTGFDQRIWELYLFAMLMEAGFDIDREINTPDFCCSGLLGKLFVEAVTVGPTMKGCDLIPPPPTDTSKQMEQFLKEYMPIKFGSPFFSKLRKKYWKQEHVQNAPFVLAIADFSSPMSMVHSQSALDRYLFGYEHDARTDENGELTIIPRRIEQHSWGDKTIPSGFFRLPDAENVSAVISSNAGTIAKFNRMGILGKFGSKRVLLVRKGTMVDHNPDAYRPKLFSVIVNSAGYEEAWIEGLNVYHNPNAKIPLPIEMLPGAAHHFCDQNTGQVTSQTPHFHPITSITEHHVPVDVEKFLREAGNKTHMVWTPKPDVIQE